MKYDVQYWAYDTWHTDCRSPFGLYSEACHIADCWHKDGGRKARVVPHAGPVYEVPRPENWVRKYYNVYPDGWLMGSYDSTTQADDGCSSTRLRVQALEVETNTGKVRLVCS